MPQDVTRLYDLLPLPSDLEAHTMEFSWGGPEAHLAPIGTTPLSKALKGKTKLRPRRPYRGKPRLVGATPAAPDGHFSLPLGG